MAIPSCQSIDNNCTQKQCLCNQRDISIDSRKPIDSSHQPFYCATRNQYTHIPIAL